jgi:hypothetical protein
MKKQEIFTLENQIETLIKDAETLISIKQDFVAFIILSIGIEILGMALEGSESSFEEHDSKNRFINGCKLFKKKYYSGNANNIYIWLRCWLVHQYRIHPKISLTSYIKNPALRSEMHLKTDKVTRKKIFIVEELLNDFIIAFENMKKGGSSKLDDYYISIIEIENASTTGVSSSLIFDVSAIMTLPD